MRIFILDGAAMTDKAAAHEYLRHTLQLPEYYGGSLDALADCLAGFNSHTHIILTSADKLYQNLGEYGIMIVELFRELSMRAAAFSFAVDGEGLDD